LIAARASGCAGIVVPHVHAVVAGEAATTGVGYHTHTGPPILIHGVTVVVVIIIRHVGTE
jgi:hypothetical protein